MKQKIITTSILLLFIAMLILIYKVARHSSFQEKPTSEAVLSQNVPNTIVKNSVEKSKLGEMLEIRTATIINEERVEFTTISAQISDITPQQSVAQPVLNFPDVKSPEINKIQSHNSLFFPENPVTQLHQEVLSVQSTGAPRMSDISASEKFVWEKIWSLRDRLPLETNMFKIIFNKQNRLFEVSLRNKSTQTDFYSWQKENQYEVIPAEYFVFIFEY